MNSATCLMAGFLCFVVGCGDDADQAPPQDKSLTGADAGMDTRGPSAVFGTRIGPEPVQSPPR